MNASHPNSGERVRDVHITGDTLAVDLADGRTIIVPLTWYPRLLNATMDQLSNWKVSGAGYGIHWPDIDEDLSTEGLLVAYEYAALESAYNLVFSAATTSPRIAAFDSFLVHGRSLVEFFQATSDKRKGHADDIRAEDYVAGWTTPHLPMWATWESSLHILLAHLSTKRNAIHQQGAGFDHRKHFTPMRDEIRTAWAQFAQGLTGTVHDGKLDPLLRAHRENFAR